MDRTQSAKLLTRGQPYVSRLVDGSDSQNGRVISVTINCTDFQVEIRVIDAAGNEIAASRVEYWNGEIVAHVWDNASMSDQGEPRTVPMVDAAGVLQERRKT